MPPELADSRVARWWKATASSSGFGDYLAHFQQVVVPSIQALPGFASGLLLSRDTRNAREIVVITIWDSHDSIATFAGPEPSRAVVHPDAASHLNDYDRDVIHYDVISAFGRQADDD